MPLYEYECPKCHHRFELIQKVGAPETHKCPKCGAKAERRLAAPAIQFKGSGWYVTDYAGKSGGASGSDGGDKSEKGGNSEKPGAKAEKKESKPEKSATSSGNKSSKKG